MDKAGYQKRGAGPLASQRDRKEQDSNEQGSQNSIARQDTERQKAR
jgi:hypothetical protein